MGYSKKEAASIAVKCAIQYKDELLNRSLLFVCTDKHLKVYTFEASFRERNYMHLTGLVPIKFTDNNGEKHILSASEFFNKCITKTISPEHFDFHKDGTTQLKLAVLPKMICKNLSATMIGDYTSFNPKLKTDKLVGKTSGVLGFVQDSIENKFLPNTLLNADIRDLAEPTLRIIATFRKHETDEYYNELTYKAKNAELDKIKLPDNLKYLCTLI